MKKIRNLKISEHEMPETEILGFKKSFSELLKRFTNLPPNGSSIGASISNNPGIAGSFLAGNPLVWIVMVAVVAGGIGFGVFRSIDKFDQEAQLENIILADTLTESQVESAINPPFPELLKTERFEIDNSSDTMIISKKGSKINIPAHAFIDADSNLVHEKVEIVWDEYQNPIEAWMSGIPMRYDSSGTSYTFLSAGMFTIKARAAGQQLQLAEDKLIEVELVSQKAGAFNTYYFDTTENAWIFLNRDTTLAKELFAESNSEENDFTYAEGDKTRNLVEPLIVRPRNKEKFVTRLDFPKDKFPELDEFKDVMFEVKVEGQDDNYVKKLFEVNWTDMDLQKTDEPGLYEILLSNWDTVQRVLAWPVVDNRQYQKAEQVHKDKVEEIEKSKIEATKKRKAQSQMRQLAGMSDQATSYRFARMLRISRLGPCNWDKPLPFPENPIALSSIFTDSLGTEIHQSPVIVLTGKMEVLWNYRASEKIYYTRDSKSMLWFVTGDNKLAIMRPEQFEDRQKTIILSIHEPEEGIAIIDRFYK